MDKMRCLIESFGRKPLLVTLASVLLLTTTLSEVASSKVNEADKQKIVRQVAENWIQVGLKQYQRGFFKASEQSFLQAQEYQEYLTAAEREKLNDFLKKVRIAALERKRILEHVQTADELFKQGEPIKAKTHLEEVRYNGFLTEQEQELITARLTKVDAQLSEQRKEIAELYDRSVEFYRAGQIEKAREGFIKIDNILAQRAKRSVPSEAKSTEKFQQAAALVGHDLLDVVAQPGEKTEPEVVRELNMLEAIAVAEPATDELGHIETNNRRRNILRSYTRAVVNDAVAKAQNYISQGEFEEAEKVVQAAEQTVNENRLHLGDRLFKQYSSELKQLNEKIGQGQE